MASHLRTTGGGGRAQKRGRGAGSGNAGGGGGGDDDDCPVCFAALGSDGARTEDARVRFPCGHSVCRACDDRMQRRGFHSCPICRTPREGFSQGEVDLAAQARTLADAAVDGDDGDGQWVPAGWTVHRMGPNEATFEEFIRSRSAAGETGQRRRGAGGWHIMFYPTEANGDPFDMLRTVAGATTQPAGRGGGGARAGWLGARRVRHSARTRERAGGAGGAGGDDDEPATDSPALPENRGGATAVPLLDDGLRDLIANHLLQPTDLNTFLARHREVTRPSRA